MTERRRTSTSNFGVGRREAHDAAAFYARFESPEVSTDTNVAPADAVEAPFVCGDARKMDTIADGSVALVVTSPPYFAGKQYEEELDRDGVPTSYLEYLQLLHDVFAECKRKLEPGGRMAINVANLGRKPYRSLSADILGILQDDLRLLPRGEVIWQKAEGAAGSCAWGSFRSAANPVLRDITERVMVVSKGRFDRAKSAKQRQLQGLPFESTLTTDEFMAATLDVWSIAPESARRVQHPAPFPVELPERLIQLYTYRHDLVLDPFMGSGSTLVAAARTSRRYTGYDLDAGYVALARGRVTEELERLQTGRADTTEDFQSRAAEQGQAIQAIAEEAVESAGFTITGRAARVRGMSIDIVADDGGGIPWYFDVSGAFTTTPGGLLRSDAVWRALGKAHVLAKQEKGPLVLLTSHLPKRSSEGDRALHAAGPTAFFDAIEMLSEAGRNRLGRYATGGCHRQAFPGFWTAQEIAGRP
jgi:DNA modification methylase